MHPTASSYWNTLRYLRPSQIANRVWRTVYRPHPSAGVPFTLRARVRDWTEFATAEPSMRGPDEFEFLGIRQRVLARDDWNQTAWPLLWRYHLHYFDDLNARDFRARSDWHHALLERWIAENPPVGGPGWDPYPASLRIVNWIRWWLGGAAASGQAMHSVRMQLARVASRLEYHLLGNHLLANGKALVFGGLFFDDRSAQRWLAQGLKILARQLPEQILSDGGHFERSPMYHQVTLASLLDLVNLMRVYDRPERAGLETYIRRMLYWSSVMRHPDGDIALFNDAAIHGAANSGTLERYAAALGMGIPIPEAPTAATAGIYLKSSGYVRVARGAYTAILNVGSVAPDYQPGHAHADTLSFELSAGGRRLFVDTGTSTYEPGSRRNWERSSAAHNGVVLNGENSSEVWGGFRVARRARVLGVAVNAALESTTVAAAHDGYRRTAARALHERRWQFTADEIRIDDVIDGRGEVVLDWILNVHPDFELLQTSSTRFMARSLDGVVVAVIDTPPELAARIAEFSYAPQFGTVRSGVKLIASSRLRLPQSLTASVQLPMLQLPAQNA